MSWYDDSNNPPGAPRPGMPPQPGQPQQMPNGLPTGPPPGVQGDLSTNNGGNNNQRMLVIIGLAVAAVVTFAGGIGAFLLLSGPEERSMGDYAEKMCDEAIEPAVKENNDLFESRDYEKRINNREIDDEQDAQEAIELAGQSLDRIGHLISEVKEFNGSHVVKGGDGDELQEELTDFTDDMNDNIKKAREALDDADPSDEEDVFDELDDAFSELDQPSIYRTDRDPGYELQTELGDVDQDCSIFYSSDEGD